jgi:Zn-dependent peptidase ImmA (M78 family)
MLENGRLPVTPDIINSVTRVLQCDSKFLEMGEHILSASRPWLRAYADAPKRQVDQQMADLTTALEASEILSLKRVPDALPAFAGDLADDNQIEDFANDVRVAAQIHEGDVVGNAIRAAERLGCIVLPMSEEMGRHVGLSTRVNLIPVVCVSRASLADGHHIPGDRQRFTVAHELGHLTLHEHVKPPDTAAEASLLEKQAHLFASAFLAPADAMIDELSQLGGRVTLHTLAQIKERWGVSIKALVSRFRSLGVIDDDHARSLYKQISSRGWNKAEPVKVGNESSVWLTKALNQWNAGRGGTLERAAEVSGLGVPYFERWSEWESSGKTLGDVVSVDFGSSSSGTVNSEEGTVVLMASKSRFRRT